MHLTCVRHTVKNYEQWRAAFDANVHMLQANGVIDTFIVRTEGDPNDIMVINTWPARENWEAFIASHKFKTPEEAKQAQEKGGVIGEPQFTRGEIV